MTDYSRDFFSGKRPWSLLKDQILNQYLPPYLKKVNRLSKRIILVDGFAGPGSFEDGSYGSPLQICQIAQKLVPDKFTAILVNKNKRHHEELSEILRQCYITKDILPIHGKASDVLVGLRQRLKDETLFLYLDQFGISGFYFDDLVPYLQRSARYSTEILMNINVPTIHRYSEKNSTSQHNTLRHKMLDQVFGGGYWRDFLYDDNKSPTEQIMGLMTVYLRKLKRFVNYVGCCPVFEKGPGSGLKYFLVFTSRHVDAAILLNNIMFKAYWKHIWNCQYQGTLFGSVVKEEELLPPSYYKSLKTVILGFLDGVRISRVDLWSIIVTKHFMKYKSSDYLSAIKELVEKGVISYIDVKKTGRLNDHSIIYSNGKI